MFLSVNNNILNEKRITTIEVDRDTPSEVNYLFSDGGIVKEKFKNHIESVKKLQIIVEAHHHFWETGDERLVNIIYIEDIVQDKINPKRLMYILYKGAPVKVLYNSEADVKAEVRELKKKLEDLRHGTGSGSGGAGSDDGGLIQMATASDFPLIGEENCIYLARDTEKIYYWDDDSASYNPMGSDGTTILEKDITSNVVCGAANAGTLFEEGMTFTEFAEKILRKDITPIISSSFSANVLNEVGTIVNGCRMTLKINNESSVTVPINEVKFYNGNNLVHTMNYVKGKSEYIYEYTNKITTDTTFKVELIYNGNIKSSHTGKVEFVYASYYGATSTANIDDALATTLASTFAKSIKKTKALTWENIMLNDARFCYMYPKSFGALTSIKDGNGFSQIDGYTKLEVNLTSPITGDVVPYYVYVLTDATTGTNFKQIYG